MMKNVKSPNPIDIHVGSRIRMRRTMLGLSQGALGEQLGITFQQIQKYEKGTNRVGASRLQAIARILQVSVSYFFESAPDASAAEVSSDMKAMTDFIASGEGIALNKAFLTIGDPTVRAKVLALVKALANDTDSE
ncbi:MAG: helix-turn-helix transcriptional regulator [Blastochloris viridis]|uniref:Helix-turn-helix transcriptional regulator n=1 Tax=Blastochloris viridis TaxID=1079 RepID=A0A6N4R1T2_BLAVI|nr:MAG: helix-turn-helix transcriptional regulator [Blastochloris viridis]